MMNIPILNIKQFKQDKELTEFYSNDLSNHFSKNKELIKKAHKHNFYLCILFIEGNGIHEIDFNTYTIIPGSIFFLKPGQTHALKFTKEPKGYIFFHTQSFYEVTFSNNSLYQFPFYYSQKNSPVLYLEKKDTIQIATYFAKLNEEYHSNYVYQESKIISLINLTYIDLTRYYIHLKPGRVNHSIRYLEILKALETLIENNFSHNTSAKFYADQLNISTKHLNRVVKNTLNKTTSELIIERVLLEAKRMMVHTDTSLSEIAETLNFEDYAYFSKVFKNKSNITPLAFRKKYL